MAEICIHKLVLSLRVLIHTLEEGSHIQSFSFLVHL